MDKLRHLAKDMTLDYVGEWNKSKKYYKNDVVRMGGSTWICTTDKYSEDHLIGPKYKPEHDSQGWEQYTSGYIWTGNYMDKGEYFPGDIVNYNGEQYACVKHGRYIHPVYEGHTRGSSFWEKISTNSNQNRGDRTIGFFNRNPFGWRQTINGREGFSNMGFTMGDVDYPGMDQYGLSVINGEYEAAHVGQHDNYGWGGSQWNYGGSNYQAVSSVFQFWDEYDGNSPRGSAYTNSTSSAPWQRPRLIQGVGDTYHHYFFLFDTGEIFAAGWGGEGQKGDGGTNNRYFTKRVGRTNNDGGSFNYNQQIQANTNMRTRGTGLMIDIQAIKIGTSNEGDYANNSSTTMGALDINGQLWTWGYNGHTGLGRNFRYNNNWYNSYIPAKIPQQVFDNRKIRDFWLGGGNYQQGHALDEDGNLWAWGYNGYGALGLGDDQYQGYPRKVPYDFNRHGGIKKIVKAGYNSYIVTAVLTHDGVMHICGYIPWLGENFYRTGSNNGNDYWSGGKTFSPMQQVFWGAGKMVEMNGSGLRQLWSMTELYNDVEDFWLNNDQGAASMVIKQRSTGMLYGVGNQQSYTFGTYDAFVASTPDFGDLHMTNAELQYPVPMNVFDNSAECIDMKRSGGGNTDYRIRAFLTNTGRISTLGSGDNEARGRGPRNSVHIHSDSIGKFPWELDGTTNYNGLEMKTFEKISCIHSSVSDDGFAMIGQNDKAYYVGQTSTFDDAAADIFGVHQTRIGGL